MVLGQYNDPDSDMLSQTMPSDPPLGYLTRLTCLQLHVRGYQLYMPTWWWRMLLHALHTLAIVRC